MISILILGCFLTSTLKTILLSYVYNSGFNYPLFLTSVEFLLLLFIVKTFTFIRTSKCVRSDYKDILRSSDLNKKYIYTLSITWFLSNVINNNNGIEVRLNRAMEVSVVFFKCRWVNN